MKSRLFKILTTFSAFVCLATIALWSRGHYASAMVWTTPKRITTGFQVDSVADSWYAPFIGKTKGILLEKDFTDAPWGWSGVDKKWLGFRYVRNDAWCPKAQLIWSYPTARSCAIFIPHWAIASLTAILPAMAIARFVRNRNRRRDNLCPKCGYDLRATPGRCPECGHEPSPAQ